MKGHVTAGKAMNKKISIEASEVTTVSSVDAYQKKVSGIVEPPKVHGSARELFADAPLPKTMTQAVREGKKDE